MDETKNKVPLPIIFISIINFIFAILLIIGSLLTIALAGLGGTSDSVMFFFLFIIFLFVIALIVAGIFLLKCRKWAKMLQINLYVIAAGFTTYNLINLALNPSGFPEYVKNVLLYNILIIIISLLIISYLIFNKKAKEYFT